MAFDILFQRCAVLVGGFYGFGFEVAGCSNMKVGFLNDHIEGNQTIVFNPAAIGPGLVHSEVQLHGSRRTGFDAQLADNTLIVVENHLSCLRVYGKSASRAQSNASSTMGTS